jgi:hypothetical protein
MRLYRLPKARTEPAGQEAATSRRLRESVTVIHFGAPPPRRDGRLGREHRKAYGVYN